MAISRIPYALGLEERALCKISWAIAQEALLALQRREITGSVERGRDLKALRRAP